MATGDSLSGDRVNIWFAPVDTVGSDLAANGAEFQSFISNFNEGGREKEKDSIAVFSDTGIHGFVTRNKPQNQGELSFDIVMRHDTRLIDFRTIFKGGTIAADGVGDDFVVGMIAIQQTDGTNYYYHAYNNVESVSFDTEFAAEEEWRGTLTFKYNPADANGISNEKEGDANITSDLTSWS